MRVVGIGGGHGLARSLAAALLYAQDVAAVVTVADDGGSSGRLVRDLGVPPPGDIRNCLVALSDDPRMSELFQHRFMGGALTGHTVGNLLIAGLTDKLGDFAEAVAEAGRLLKSRGRVYPATTQLVTLRARVNGGEVRGQVAVAQSRSPIQAVYLDPPDPAALPDAVNAIMEADQIILGPGSLFTSLIATLLVPGVRRAVQETSARRVFVCNSRVQKGETDGLDAAAHLGALLAHAGAYAADVALVQSPVLANEGVTVERSALEFPGIAIVEADVADDDGGHDPEKLAAVLRRLG